LVIIPVMSLKGGVGKTTLSINMADLLAEKYKVLLIDTDPQNSVASLLCKNFDKGLSELLKGEATIDEILIKVEKEKNFFIIPAGDYAIINPIEYEQLFTKEKLREILNHLQKYDFDYIIFDTAPRISKPLDTILNFATLMLIVILPLPASIASFEKFLKYLNAADVKNYSVIVNKLEANRVNEDFYLLIQSLTDDNLFATIPKDLKVVEAEGNCAPVSQYAPNSVFLSFLQEAVDKVEKIGEK